MSTEAGMTHYYGWRTGRRAELYRRRCRVVAAGRMGSVKVQWDDGSCDIVSRRALRRMTPAT